MTRASTALILQPEIRSDGEKGRFTSAFEKVAARFAGLTHPIIACIISLSGRPAACADQRHDSHSEQSHNQADQEELPSPSRVGRGR